MLLWKIQSFVHYEILHGLLHGVKCFNHRCDSALKHSSTSFPLELRCCELKWLPMCARKHLMSVLLFSPCFYNIEALSCILGTYQLCTKWFFFKGKQCWGNNLIPEFTWWVESLVKVQEVAETKLSFEETWKQTVAPKLFAFERCVQECTSGTISAIQALLLLVSL